MVSLLSINNIRDDYKDIVLDIYNDNPTSGSTLLLILSEIAKKQEELENRVLELEKTLLREVK